MSSETTDMPPPTKRTKQEEEPEDSKVSSISQEEKVEGLSSTASPDDAGEECTVAVLSAAAPPDDAGEERTVAVLSAAASTEESNGSTGEERVSSGSPLREVDVGITQYISTSESVSGVIKQRYSDFIVNEICKNGAVVRLDDMSLGSSTFNEEKADVPSASTLSTLISPGDLEKIAQLCSGTEKSVRFEAPLEKDKRKDIHAYIKAEHPKLNSACVEVAGVKHMEISRSQLDVRDLNKNRKQWGKKTPDYVHFTLYKEFKDTVQALNVIAKYLHIQPKRFTFAGTKDKRAKTSQRVAVYRIAPEDLLAVNKQLLGMAIGNFKYETEPLRLGDLLGNRFTITMRNVIGQTSQIEKAIQSLQTHGFLNYYGMQRFGTGGKPTHQVGAAILRSNFLDAIDLIMTPSLRDSDAVTASDQWLKHRDANGAFNRLSPGRHLERDLMKGVRKLGIKDAKGALEYLPRTTRLMYVHAYQSSVWNAVVSQRFLKYGLQLIVGDLVLKGEGEEEEVVVLTESNVTGYTIHDLVYPLPGFAMQYPNNEVKSWYEEKLQTDGFDFSSFKSKHKDYALRGSYRKMICKPGDLTWRLAKYDDMAIPLTMGDLDVYNQGETTSQDVPSDGSLSALILEFSLPSSSYATMMLREITKADTSSAHQSSLN